MSELITNLIRKGDEEIIEGLKKELKGNENFIFPEPTDTTYSKQLQPTVFFKV